MLNCVFFRVIESARNWIGRFLILSTWSIGNGIEEQCNGLAPTDSEMAEMNISNEDFEELKHIPVLDFQ